ncbi:hypothetical protein RvY_14606 [Ramazzottius varieornatus]|uniref:folate gamma-glutamyl hydrolase n=1 Tax=Ramazzottius varieornatus TaxID=947166 RepID=A0A1D1VZ56_RAMVA|nr:hypothetical protein RvY_14606 [Ramazzottius varieornatus]
MYFECWLGIFLSLWGMFIFRSIGSLDSTIKDANANGVNTRPIIGIVTERLYAPSPDGSNHTDTKSSFIAASYVKWIESGGARVVPILMDKHEDYYAKMFHSVNGVMFPGGAVSLNHSGYARAGRFLLKLAINEAASGGYFPVWGTCLGFELISEIMASDPRIISKCSAENISLSIDLSPDFKSSRLFGSSSPEITDILQGKNLTANSHHFCVTTSNFEKYHMTDHYRLLSTSTTPSGETFVSAMEGKTYPIYGVQFHPEKSNFEWRHPSAVSHSAEAVLVSQFFANFFVSEARKNNHRFPSQEQEDDALIYNWNPVFSKNTVYDQIYVFPF